MNECDKPYKAKPMERQADGFNVIGPTADGLVLKVQCPSLGEATFLAMTLNLAHAYGASLATAAIAEKDAEIERLRSLLNRCAAELDNVPTPWAADLYREIKSLKPAGGGANVS